MASDGNMPTSNYANPENANATNSLQDRLRQTAENGLTPEQKMTKAAMQTHKNPYAKPSLYDFNQSNQIQRRFEDERMRQGVYPQQQ
jgi:hypothetical protein